MKTLILDGFNDAGGSQAGIIEAAAQEVKARGWEEELLTPREMELAPCSGCFGCWMQRPGMCVQEDHADELCRRIMESDLILTITPVTFGGYSSSSKAALDRTIGLVSPFFTMVGGEVHHKLRYERMPSMAVLGINHGDCDACARTFEELIYRNAINFHPPAVAVDVVEEEDISSTGPRKLVDRLLDRIVTLPASDLPVRCITKREFAPLSGDGYRDALSRGAGKSALVLTGSPRRRSTSSAIGDELLDRLARKGWRTETLGVLDHLVKAGSWTRLADAAAEADLVVLTAPLYVDSLPASVTRALERLARQREKDPALRKQGFMAILNCGFPEAFHNYTGLAIARQFAVESGYDWLGGLALGMGGAIDGKALAECGRMARNVLKALDLTASSLDRGEPVPAEAVDLMGKPFMPRWLYILMGNWGWKRRARKYGVKRQLHARPYQGFQAQS